MAQWDSYFPRYQRQINLPQIGEEGQEKLFNAKVLVVGTGGLGSPILYYLAAAGIGTLGFMDYDTVDITNLQRQILHWERDLGRFKVESAQEKLRAMNSHIKLEGYSLSLNEESARRIFPAYDLVIGAVDNRETRIIINQVCYETGKVWIEGGVSGFFGVVTTFVPPRGPCYHCLYPDAPTGEKKTPFLLGPLAGVIGLLQAQEALKVILGIGTPLIGKLLLYDALESRFDMVNLQKAPLCPVCK